jgi:surface polysaccharide O-acyltransferase-like enzyme
LILAIISVGLIYSPAMPFLYVILLLAFIILYFFDKVMILKVFELPPVIDYEFFFSILIIYLWIGIYHLILTGMVLGNDELFVNPLPEK